MSYWIDICVNLTDKRFAKDQPDIVEQAVEANVKQMIIAGTNLANSEAALTLCQQYPEQLYCTAGVHPHDAKDATPTHWRNIRALLNEQNVVAVGETGLDFNRDFSPRPQQIAAFEQQLELAADCHKPLLLHERDAHQQQYEMLTSARDHITGGVIHCFTGERKALYNYLDLDLYIGITGWVCDERRGEQLQQLVKDIPADRLLLETDAPYLLPRDIKPKPKGGRNSPALLPHIGSTVARLRNEDWQQLQHQSTTNATRLFQLPAL
ncbi:MAG: YchF/TatD family DNA exonuclease [Marinobacterium sp.]|nr:YchF/TatD family DNA exonuclease [Marinobacterium sp.]